MNAIGSAIVLLVLSVLYPVAKADFLPPNDLHLQDSIELMGVSGQAEFNEVIEKARKYYEPLIRDEHGGRLVIRADWRNRTVNASASRSGRTWYVNMYGGMARHRSVTPDAFALVLCHEIGHHMGGYPARGWAAAEGQADYFATHSCARDLWEGEVEVNAGFRGKIGNAEEKCDAVWADTSARDLCYRILAASESLAGVLGGGGRVSLETTDPRRVWSTSMSHPRGQCRLDTYVAGALCDVSFDTGLIPRRKSDLGVNSCVRSEGLETGVRPQCWYRP